MQQRRSIRSFSSREVPLDLIETVIASAGTSPSGANKQPWRFVVIGDPELKRTIRKAAEEEEKLFYAQRASQDWLHDLEIIGTDENKPFLEAAPWLIAVFKLMKDDRQNVSSEQVYYVNESIGIAVGMLLAAAQHAGLATLTHTPSPMRFLGDILDRPSYERPYMLIPIGWPADDATVPDIERKPLSEIMVMNRGEQP
ncbi:MAG: nitroreductase family protein [Phycisphaerales bacterium]|nr:nitroreductase family protein [Phycisphaerales bacterium]